MFIRRISPAALLWNLVYIILAFDVSKLSEPDRTKLVWKLGKLVGETDKKKDIVSLVVISLTKQRPQNADETCSMVDRGGPDRIPLDDSVK